MTKTLSSPGVLIQPATAAPPIVGLPTSVTASSVWLRRGRRASPSRFRILRRSRPRMARPIWPFR
ncbi:MAG: hypothetical protein QM608_13520 [Caulobacter sp.]